MKPEAIPQNGRLVVIGGVAAGMSAASQVKRRRPDVQVTALEQGDYVSYGACGMPYNIEDPDRDMEDLVVISPQQFREKRGIDVRTGHRVESIDRQRKMVIARSAGSLHEFPYDRLVIATGASPVRSGIPGGDAPGIHALHTLASGKKLKDMLKDMPQSSPVVIIGGGYIAMEMAEVLTRRGMQVTVVVRSMILRRFSDAVRNLVEAALARHGVKVVQGAVSSYVTGDGQRIGVILENGESIDAAMVIEAIGIRPNADLARDAGLDIGDTGAIAVNEYGQTSDPDIFAGGDCAEAPFKLGGPAVYTPLGDTANKQGKLAGANICGAGEEFSGIVNTSIFRVFDQEVATTGVNETGAEKLGFTPLVAEITGNTRAHGYPGAKKIMFRLVFDAPTGRILGAETAAGEGAWRINVLSTAIDAGMTISRLGGLDLAYAPPFSPVWDPLLTLAAQAQKVQAAYLRNSRTSGV